MTFFKFMWTWLIPNEIAHIQLLFILFLHYRKTEERKKLDKKQMNDQKAKLEIGNDHSTLLLLLVLGQEGKREKNG